MVTRIPHRGKVINARPERPPKDTRELRSFLLFNNAADCFVRAQGGWYKICKDGSLKYVTRAMYQLSLKEFLEIAKNDHFIANHKELT